MVWLSYYGKCKFIFTSFFLDYFIWGAKLGKFIPSADFVVGETVYLLDNACSLNSELDACRTTLTLSRMACFGPKSYMYDLASSEPYSLSSLNSKHLKKNM